MYEIQLNPRTVKLWEDVGDGSFVRGFAFDGDKLLKGNNLYVSFISAIEKDEINSFIKRLNGNFVAILQYHETFYLIVDKIRSFPLFYFSRGDKTFITDSDEIIESFNDLEFNSREVAELLALGYLSGRETLVKEIYQVVAGTYVIIKGGEFTVNEYFSHIYPKVERNKEELFAGSKTALENTFKRLIQSVEGRPLLIPLSGGYDSRLLACLCKQFNLTDVTCFTYGRADSFEVAASRKVAERLGYPWYFVEYTDQLWRDTLNAALFRQYCKFAGNLTANPHYQDFPALLELQKNGVIKPDMIVMPGHNGDLLGGSKIPIPVVEKRGILCDHKYLTRLIYDSFYKLNTISDSSKQEVEGKILKDISVLSLENQSDLLDIYESYWFIKSKIANFLVNSTRGYEFFGLEWRLPQWDDEYVSYWYSVPWEDKHYSVLYNEFMFEEYFKPCNVDFTKGSTLLNKNGAHRLKHFLPQTLSDFLRTLIRKYRSMTNKKHFNAFDVACACLERQMTGERNSSIIKKKNSADINAVTARYYLELIQKRK